MKASLKKIAWIPTLAVSTVFAQQSTLLDPVVVTTTRFAESAPRFAGNMTVIERNDITVSPARNLPELLQTVAGIRVASLSGSMGIDAAIDLRGFGDTGMSNTLILLDGQRLSPIDMGGIDWSAIPLSNIERIEVIRGSGTVLYGDRATGGVINIITGRTTGNAASITAGVGSYGARNLDGDVAWRGEAAYLNLHAHYAQTNGWRQNNQADQASVAGRAGWNLGNTHLFADFAAYQESSGSPASVAEAVYLSSPKQARTPRDTQRTEGFRLRPGIAVDLSERLRFEAEISLEKADQQFNNVSFGSVFDRSREMISLTPRLRWNHGLAGLRSETVAGADYYAGEVTNTFSSFAGQQAEQTSAAAYVQNTTNLTAPLALTLGFRTQRMDQKASQDAYPAWFLPAMSGSANRTRNAWDAGLAYDAAGWHLYGKVGTTFRFANTDELFGYDSLTGNPVFAGNLKPQHGTIGEIGAGYRAGTVSAQASIYQMDLEDEIGYDGALFANVNFDPTQRRGLESELAWQATSTLKLKASYTYSEARFREGTYRDNDVPMVPKNKAALQLNWNGGALGQYGITGNYVGERRFSGDYANIRKLLDGYTTVDLFASWEIGALTISARVLNATDKRYAPFALYSPSNADYYYFPADGRSFFLTTRYTFK